MANEAVISFLFNTQGAMRGLDNFKKKFSDVMDGIENSSIGKFTAIGSAIAGAFSIKAFADYTKAVADFTTLWSMPIDQVGRFANEMKLLNRSADIKEVLGSLTSFQNKLNDFKTGNWVPPALFDILGVNIMDNEGNVRNALEVMEDLIQKYREFPDKANIDKDMFTEMMQSLGLSESVQVSMIKRMKQTEAEFDEYTKKLNRMFVPSEKDNQMLERFNTSITELESSFRKFGQSLLENGFIKDIIEGITGAIDKFNKLPDDTQKKIFGYAAAFMALGPSIKILKGIGWLINPWIIFAGVVGAVANNVGGLKDKLEEFQNKYNNWVSEVSKEHPALGAWLKEIGKLIDAILHPIDNLKQAWADLKKEFSIDFKIPESVKKSLNWLKQKLNLGVDGASIDTSSDSNTASEQNQKPIYIKDYDAEKSGKNVNYNQTNVFNIEGNMTDDVGRETARLNGSVMGRLVNQDGGSYSGRRF